MRTPRSLTLLTVLRVEWLHDGMVRVVFRAPGFPGCAHTDAYIKLQFDDDGPIVEERSGRQPTRTYTVRHFDPTTNELAVDFVVHGDVGRAGPWAMCCQPGDQVLASGPGGRWSPAADADSYLFVGDESALPAIANGIEALSPDARGVAIIEYREHTLPIDAPEGVEVRWVKSEVPYRAQLLAEHVASLDWEELGDVEVFAHGERGAMKELRAVFREKKLGRNRLSTSGYWACGRREDEFQAEKRSPIGQV